MDIGEADQERGVQQEEADENGDTQNDGAIGRGPLPEQKGYCQYRRDQDNHRPVPGRNPGKNTADVCLECQYHRIIHMPPTDSSDTHSSPAA